MENTAVSSTTTERFNLRRPVRAVLHRTAIARRAPTPRPSGPLGPALCSCLSFTNRERRVQGGTGYRWAPCGRLSLATAGAEVRAKCNRPAMSKSSTTGQAGPAQAKASSPVNRVGDVDRVASLLLRSCPSTSWRSPLRHRSPRAPVPARRPSPHACGCEGAGSTASLVALLAPRQQQAMARRRSRPRLANHSTTDVSRRGVDTPCWAAAAAVNC